MKKIILGFLSILMCLSLTSCTKAKPEDAVKGYFEAVKAFDTDKMKTFVNEKETIESITKVSKSDDKYFKYVFDYYKTNATKMSYKINSSETKADKAVVTVDCKYVDGSTLCKETTEEAFKKLFLDDLNQKGPTDEEMSRELVNTMSEKQKVLKEVTTEKTIIINCVKVDKKWYIESINDDLKNIMTSNFFSVTNSMKKANENNKINSF
ncbi:hypothetical protein [Clostridium sp. 'White wine YQ']|uniref:hypothetical protein n=1 Tax=Clostridium sp. 'White wine YQ' TaxID=3027474 RepID=UPI002365B3B4|nr:hypothetical protein [Clostridium sp. 'White wine YQ']MDD7794376.1 hypothetical protein [Clostridium sp. 'White wine YQ']